MEQGCEQQGEASLEESSGLTGPCRPMSERSHWSQWPGQQEGLRGQKNWSTTGCYEQTGESSKAVVLN